MDTILLDKTGTITEGRPAVTQVVPAAGFTGADLLAVAADVERHSEHPLAEAIVGAAQERALVASPATDFVATPGLGASALIEGRKILIGNQRLLQSNGVRVDTLLAKAEQLSAAGATPVFVSVTRFWPVDRNCRSDQEVLGRRNSATAETWPSRHHVHGGSTDHRTGGSARGRDR